MGFLKKHAAKSVFSLCFAIAVLFVLCSCMQSKKQRALNEISDILRTEYTSDVSFRINDGNYELAGTACIIKGDNITAFDIKSPDPYSGLCIEYDVSGLPSSVSVHFSGMDATVPKEAVTAINSVAVLFADDFASALSKTEVQSIMQYTLPNGGDGYCAQFVYSGADICVYFSSDVPLPSRFEYRSGDIEADVVFDSFDVKIITDDKK